MQSVNLPLLLFTATASLYMFHLFDGISLITANEENILANPHWHVLAVFTILAKYRNKF